MNASVRAPTVEKVKGQTLDIIFQFGTTGLPNGWMSAGGGEDVRMPLEFPVILLRPTPLMSPQSCWFYHLIATGSRPCSLRGSRTGGPACSSALCAGADRAQMPDHITLDVRSSVCLQSPAESPEASVRCECPSSVALCWL